MTCWEQPRPVSSSWKGGPTRQTSCASRTTCPPVPSPSPPAPRETPQNVNCRARRARFKLSAHRQWSVPAVAGLKQSRAARRVGAARVPFSSRPTTECPMASRVSASRLDVNELLTVLLAVRGGDFTARLRADMAGNAGRAADALNDVIGLNQALSDELKRLSETVGKQGRTSE